MGLRDFVSLLKWNWVALVVLATLGVALGWFVADRTEPLYRASNTVFVSAQTGSSTADLNAGASFIARQMKTYTEVARSPKVLSPVIDELGLDTSPSSLRGDVSAAIQGGDTQLITIAVTRPDGKQAARIADAVAGELATAVVQLSPPRDDGSPSVLVTSVSPASAPSSPVVPNTPRNMALGLVIGLIIGFGWALTRATLETKVRTQRDVTEQLDAPILAAVVSDPKLASRRHRTQSNQRTAGVLAAPQSLRSEQYRQLRTNLQFLDATRRPRTILVTSARGGEGKSVTAINLAAILAQSGGRVCLVDADLRRPSVARYLGLEGEAGLTTVLIGQADLDDVLQPVGEDGLQVLASGVTPPNPSELLGSDRMQQVVDSLLTRFDTVVIDCAPLLPVTDAAVLSRLTDGVLLTVGCGVVTREQLRDAADRLGTIGARTLGVVVNRLSQRASTTGSYGYTTRPVLPRGGAHATHWQQSPPTPVPVPVPVPAKDRPVPDARVVTAHPPVDDRLVADDLEDPIPTPVAVPGDGPADCDRPTNGAPDEDGPDDGAPPESDGDDDPADDTPGAPDTPTDDEVLAKGRMTAALGRGSSGRATPGA